MNKFKNIQALRGIAVMSVVFFHLVTVEQRYGGAETLLPRILEFGMFGVDLFFVISGFVMVTVTRGKFQDMKEASRFLYHRVTRIYPIYWVYTILVLCVFLVRPSMVNSSQGNQADILASFLLYPVKTLPLVMVGWTLIHEMYFYLVFFLAMSLVPERRLNAALLAWGTGIVFLNAIWTAPGPLAALVTHPLTIEFIGGCYLAGLFYGGKNVTISSRLLLITAAFSFCAAAYGYHSFQGIAGHAAPEGWWRVLIFGLPALSMVFCLINAERNGFVLHTSLVRVGDASYSIYLSHVLTLNAAGRVWGAFSSNTVFDNIVMLPVLLALVVMVGTASYRFIERPLLALSRKIA